MDLVAGCTGGAQSTVRHTTAVTTPASLTSGPELVCDLGADLPTTDVVVKSPVRLADSYTSRNGIAFQVLQLASPDNTVLTVDHVREPLIGDDIQTSLEQVLVSQTSALIDRSVADSLPTETTTPLLFIHTGSIGNGQIRPLLIAAARQANDGSVRFVGECASSWQFAIDRASAQFATRPDLDFVAKVAQWSTPEAAAVVGAHDP